MRITRPKRPLSRPFAARFTTRKVPVNYMSRADFTAMVLSEYEAYGRILRELGVQPE